MTSQVISDCLEALELVAKWKEAARGADDDLVRELLLEKVQWECGEDVDAEAEVERTFEEDYSLTRPRWESFCSELDRTREAAIDTIIYEAQGIGGIEAVEALDKARQFATEEQEERKLERAQQVVAIDFLSDIISEVARRRPQYSNKSISRYWEFGNTKLRLSDHELPPTYSPSDIDITVGRLNPDTHYHLAVPYTTDQLLSLEREVRELIAKLLEREKQEEDSEEE